MNIQCIKEFDLGSKLAQVRSVPVRLKTMNAVLFLYSSQPNIDPWPELFNYPTDTYKMALYTEDGIPIWKRDLGPGVIPGVWYSPFISFDLDEDGIDEIWFLNNLNPHLPFSLNARVLERVDPVSGKTTGTWKWPDNTIDDTMSHSYRFFITGGYAKGKPVIITAQGTYRNMYLQGHDLKDGELHKRWDIMIPYDDGGPRSSHLCPVLDFDNDGVDELFWGERLISFEDGHEVLCCDKGRYFGHSDIVAPFEDVKTGKRYIYTCREDYEKEGEPRVVTFDSEGNRAWSAVMSMGHMHNGWLANIGDNYRKVAMAMRITRKVINNAIKDTAPESFYFDAVTGEELFDVLPFAGYDVMPIDFDGDGYHEFYADSGDDLGYVFNSKGEVLGFIGGTGVVRSGKVLSSRPAEMLMVFYRDEGKVRIFADTDAKDCPYVQKRFSHPYHYRMQHFMGTGYNHGGSHITCGM